ncbi:hypothetical protein MUK42_05407 [Musa troglodytarum]|uniref:Uncharacterized protein n=1 Tax=Musa troglodytarum TaxID=320322 RepID=A0A9E7K9G9_9LILI|nr:hypothetical protein MUK42_05407 [Musa troglodytarum]
MAKDQGRLGAHAFPLYSLLFCLFLLALLRQPRIPLKTDGASSSSSSRRLLSPSSSQSMKLHPKSANSTSQFEASEHEVPSGPNPVSNR